MYAAQYRLRKSQNIEKLFKYGKSFLTPIISFKFMRNNLNTTRFAVVVGTKVHKRAHKRNLIKRRIRSAIAENISRIKPGYDVAVSARPAILESDFQEIKAKIDWAFQKIGLI